MAVIVDPMPEMWKQRFNFPMFYYYQQKVDYHPFEGFSFVAAQVLSDVLKRYKIEKTDNPITIEDAVLTKSAFWPEGNLKYIPKTDLYIKSVVQNGESIGALKVNTGSPFLFLSNSYFKHPRKELGASVPGYTAFFMQMIPDWMLREGSGNSIMRLLFQDKSVLSKRKAVIMGVHPTAQWRGFPEIPKYIVDDAKSLSLEKTYDFLSPEITIHDNNLFDLKKKDASVQFVKNNTNQFSFELTIPDCDNKSTCVLRLNFDDAFQIGITAIDVESGKTIDFVELAQMTSKTADLYIPALYFTKRIKIKMKLHYPDRDNTIRNLELWYY